MAYEYIKDFKHDDVKRKALNKLTRETFDFDFEEWYQKGFWGNMYMPHSLVDKGEVIANVSVNIMDFTIGNTIKHYIQIGTVMTDKRYQNQGLGRWLMEKVIELYYDNVDGIYLFCNDQVLNYYPKFGFIFSNEYKFSRKIRTHQQGDFIKVSNPTEIEKKRYMNYVKQAVANDGFFTDNIGLTAFWTANMDEVYYSKEMDVYINARVKNKCLILNNVIAKHSVSLNKIIDSFGNIAESVELGFTPKNREGFKVCILQQKDSSLFYMGKDLERIEKDKLMFPVYSHA